MVGDGAAEAWQQRTAAVGADATPAWRNCGGCGGSGFLLKAQVVLGQRIGTPARDVGLRDGHSVQNSQLIAAQVEG